MALYSHLSAIGNEVYHFLVACDWVLVIHGEGEHEFLHISLIVLQELEVLVQVMVKIFKIIERGTLTCQSLQEKLCKPGVYVDSLKQSLA